MVKEEDAAALAADVKMLLYVRGHDVALSPEGDVRLLRLAALMRAEFTAVTRRTAMTDRHAGYVVALAKDIREDDAQEGVLNAIRMIKGVVSVEPVVADIGTQLAENRRDSDWRKALYGLAADGPPKP